MLTGFVAALDALGFKGIWRSYKPEWVIDKLVRVQAQAMEHAYSISHAPEQTIFRALSDTIVMASYLPEGMEEVANEFGMSPSSPLYTLAYAIEWLQFSMLTERGIVPELISYPCLAYRGAVSYGEFFIHDNFLIGPAIDEAVEAEHNAEGAFVYLCPSVVAHVAGDAGDPMEELLRYSVPMKDGTAVDTYVIPPAYVGSEDELRAAVHEAFQPHTGSIESKYLNTMRMIERAIEHRRTQAGKQHDRQLQVLLRKLQAGQC